MFRKCQKFSSEGFFPVLVSQMVNQDGVLIPSEVPAKDVKPLPPVETFDIEKMLEAGVDLKRVSVKIPSKSVDIGSIDSENKNNNNKE